MELSWVILGLKRLQQDAELAVTLVVYTTGHSDFIPKGLLGKICFPSSLERDELHTACSKQKYEAVHDAIFWQKFPSIQETHEKNQASLSFM